ncbi:uncharacterized protein B0H18DRAFT_820278, partial [Fomitopsis serialis]|uniref:uncharacterized protein n=1 Tax=Fomitopsis serialis TaxID=139415 RepID=UPI00200884D3
PFSNPTVFRLMNWAHSGSTLKTGQEVDKLVHDVVLAGDFDKEDLQNFRYSRECDRLDHVGVSPQETLATADGWHEASVKIRLPKEKVVYTSEDACPQFEVSGIHYRKLLDVIKGVAQSADARYYDWLPFQLLWRRPKGSSPTSDSESE